MLRNSAVLAGVALMQLGCAEQLQLLARQPTAGVSPCSFWPPPPSSATWLVEAPNGTHGDLLSSVAGELEVGLRDGGYSEQRWYPIGAGNNHGFAVTTRLEQVGGDAESELNQRWSALYREGASLRWLQQARNPQLPGPGRYRVFLISYTDLPIGRTSSAPTWNEETVMDWPNAAQRKSFRPDGAPRRSSIDYRFGIYEYEYEYDEDGVRGRFVPENGGQSERAEPLPAPLREALGLERP
jgi:hypothetical protein